MSKHDSHQDDHSPELAELEARMRQSRPQIDPMSLTTKRRLRAQLLEDTRMNESKITIKRLVAGVVALILIIGLPVYFWAILSSLGNGAASQPAAAEPSATATATLSPTFTSTPLPTSTDVMIEAGSTEDETAVNQAPTSVPPTVPPIEPVAQAEIIHIGEPVEMEIPDSNVPSGTLYNVPIEISYSLQGYEEAVLFIGFKLKAANGASGGTFVANLAPANGGQIITDLNLNDYYFMADGSLNPGIEFDLHINTYDAAEEQYVNIFPGDLELPPEERDMPYHDPTSSDYLALNAVTISDMAADELELTLSLSAVVASEDVGTITAVISSDSTKLVTKTITVTQDSIAINLPISLTDLNGDESLVVDTVLNVGDGELESTGTVTLPALATAVPNSVWLIDMSAEPNGDAVFFTFVVGYQIDEPYTGGLIEHRSSFTAPSTGGGGGGGGGSINALPVGTGVATIRFGMGGSGLTAENWQDFLTTEIELKGFTAENGPESIGTVVISPENE